MRVFALLELLREEERRDGARYLCVLDRSEESRLLCSNRHYFRSSVNRNSPFSYVCNACGLCCHNKVITLSPYDVMRLARSANLSTREAIDRFTIRRGSILKFTDVGACVALEGSRCGPSRASACLPAVSSGSRTHRRVEWRKFCDARARENYGIDGDVNSFLEAQGIAPYLAANARYASLLAVFRERIAATIDFDRSSRTNSGGAPCARLWPNQTTTQIR